MADFVAVLKKTIEGLPENTPEARDRVYTKARATIDAKLAALNPQPPEAVILRQRQAIDDAIKAVETQYAPIELMDDDLDDLDQLFVAQPTEVVPAPEPDDRSIPAMPRADVFASQPEHDQDASPVDDRYEAETADDQVGERPVSSFDQSDEPRARFAEPRPRRRFAGGLVAALALLLVAGGAYAVWLNGDVFGAMVGLTSTQSPNPDEVAEGTDAPEETTVENEIAAAEALGDESEPAAELPAATEPNEQAADLPAMPEDEQVAALDPAEGTDEGTAQPTVAATPASTKFTQRLQEDGSEIDSGPAGAPASIGESTSVSELTQTAQATLPSATDATTPAQAETPAAETATTQPTDQSVAVGQRAIFYEERTASAAGTAENGSIVWSVVQESPGGDAQPEPAIRAEATIPGRDIQLRMTIRRNADPTLPASHIMEMIFLTPENLEGGGFESLVRVALKDSEQSTGSPIQGIPAKIADGFFLVALSDSPNEIQANLRLLQQENWLDVPLVYKSGRRALITLEKGIPGERVFEEAMRAWGVPSSG